MEGSKIDEQIFLPPNLLFEKFDAKLINFMKNSGELAGALVPTFCGGSSNHSGLLTFFVIGMFL